MKNLLITLTLVLLSITNVQANVFASAVEISYSGTFPATISYSLNQNATSVVINIKDQTGAIVKVINIAADTEGAFLGFNDVDWDGTLDAGGSATSGVYSIEIEAIDNVGSDGFELISYDTGPDSWYWSPGGVAANTRQASPYFGMTYVAERTGGTSTSDGGGPTERGVYLHDSHGRYFGQSLASAYATGNSLIDWNAYADYEGSPQGVTIGPDDRVYAFVLTSNGVDSGVVDGGVAMGDALFSTESIETILTFDHDAISDALVVGLGADRVLYTVEQTSERTGSDNDKEGDGDGFDAAHILKYALGESTGTFTGAGEVVIPTSTLGYPYRIEMDSEGYLYVVQQVWDALAISGNIYGLSKWDISGNTPNEIWHIGLNDAPEHLDSIANADNARATNFNGLGLDEAGGHVYVTRKHTNRPLHNVMSYNMSTGAFEASFCAAQSIVGTDTTDLPGGSGSSIRDLTVDAAGNVMVVNSSFEAFRIYSPPAGANSYTTVSSTLIDVTNGTTGVEEIHSELPTKYSLEQNYPNPFNPTTKISFSIPNNEVVTMTIYNSLGEKMSTLLNESLAAGSYEVNFNASGYSSGLYLYKISAGSYSSTKKMLLLK
ncbi:MAG: T9SS type A sorting domain-containing protein [Labilibaculum sp.]|nr:FlgD immunoglobulin-like domain containing protein [Labilibaculum sp.]MBI9060180.1 T9SS type A sorting domain-containing protein [Labilibaculum sp.]